MTSTVKRSRTSTSTCDSSAARLSDENTFKESAEKLEASLNTTALLLFDLRHSPDSYFSVASADISALVTLFTNTGCLRVDKVYSEMVMLDMDELVGSTGLGYKNVRRMHLFSYGSIIQCLTCDDHIVVIRIADSAVISRTYIKTLACTHESAPDPKVFITCNGVVITVCAHCHEATVYWLGTVVAIVDDDIVFGNINAGRCFDRENVYVTESLKVITFSLITGALLAYDIKTKRKDFLSKGDDVRVSVHRDGVSMSVDRTEKYICIGMWTNSSIYERDETLVYSLCPLKRLTRYDSYGCRPRAIDCRGTVIGDRPFLHNGDQYMLAVSIENTCLSKVELASQPGKITDSFHVTSGGQLVCLVFD